MPTETLMMKDSKIDWIGDIPDEWNIKKIKHISNVHSSVRIFEDEYKDQGIPFFRTKEIVELANNKEISLELYISEDKYKTFRSKKVEKGDLLISSIGTIGEVWVCDGRDFWYKDGNITQIDKNDSFVSNYLKHLITSNIFMENIKFYESTTTISALTIEKIKEVKFPLPNLKEQQAIADFLDEKCEKIDKVISEIEEQIQVLEDYKKSLITETVTKGLDKNVPMKDSGIDWIGKIPAKWEIKRIKYFTNLNGRIGWQGLTTEDYQDEGPFLITGVDFLNGSIDWNSCTHITEKRWIEANTIQIKNDDLLITKDGTVGKVAVVSGLNDKASLNSGVLLIRPKGNVEYYNRYIYYQLISDVFWSWFEFNKSGNSTIIHLYQQDFANLYTLLPNIAEQKQIADYLDKECEKIDATISDKKEQLETIKEYKKSLIYEYVTGKKRVAC